MGIVFLHICFLEILECRPFQELIFEFLSLLKRSKFDKLQRKLKISIYIDMKKRSSTGLQTSEKRGTASDNELEHCREEKLFEARWQKVCIFKITKKALHIYMSGGKTLKNRAPRIYLFFQHNFYFQLEQ